MRCVMPKVRNAVRCGVQHNVAGIGSLQRVLGAYHANVIYTGPGARDQKSCRIHLLWVRWFEVVDPASSGWSKSGLDLVQFPPMRQSSSFGFVDPRDVLRGCHILPASAKGRRQADGVGVSRCAKDGEDYCLYYVGQCVQTWRGDFNVNPSNT